MNYLTIKSEGEGEVRALGRQIFGTPSDRPPSANDLSPACSRFLEHVRTLCVVIDETSLLSKGYRGRDSGGNDAEMTPIPPKRGPNAPSNGRKAVEAVQTESHEV